MASVWWKCLGTPLSFKMGGKNRKKKFTFLASYDIWIGLEELTNGQNDSATVQSTQLIINAAYVQRALISMHLSSA
jgi:hypothetical protein